MKNITLGVLFSFFSLVPAFLRADATDYRDMGQALYQKGLYAKAVDYFRQAVAADPNDWQSYQTMGDAYLKMDAKAEALDAYQKSLKINPDNNQAQTQVDNLAAAGVQVPTNSTSNPPADQFEEGQPVTETQTTVIKRRRVFVRPTPVVYNDGLAAMDHAKTWSQFSIGYAYSRNGDLNTSAANWSSDINSYGWSGSALSSNDGLELGFEWGFLLNPNSGLSLGVKYINVSDYKLNVGFNDGPITDVNSTVYGSDYDQSTFSPFVVPLTLDYYLFLPDSGGRFWLSGGLGYYLGVVHVERNYQYLSSTNPDGTDPNQIDQYTGDLYAGGLGFQVGIGRDFAISQNMSLTLFARGRYARLTNFQGNMTDPYGNYFKGGLAMEPSITGNGGDPGVFVEDVNNIGGAGGNQYAIVDFTGFDIGLALNFYSL